MDIEKFVFAGDSAGGHLTMSVTNLCLLRGFRPPDGLIPIYPVLSMDLATFFPSTLMMADDELISTGFVTFACACVIRKGGDPATNPLMSPYVSPDALIKLLPPTQFYVCEIDGLRDQTYGMAIKMLRQGCQVHIHHMAEYVHGFCNMDNSGVGVTEFSNATEEIINTARELLGMDDNANHER